MSIASRTTFAGLQRCGGRDSKNRIWVKTTRNRGVITPFNLVRCAPKSPPPKKNEGYTPACAARSALVVPSVDAYFDWWEILVVGRWRLAPLIPGVSAPATSPRRSDAATAGSVPGPSPSALARRSAAERPREPAGPLGPDADSLRSGSRILSRKQTSQQQPKTQKQTTSVELNP